MTARKRWILPRPWTASGFAWTTLWVAHPAHRPLDIAPAEANLSLDDPMTQKALDLQDTDWYLLNEHAGGSRH
jgi:hypothetical protein